MKILKSEWFAILVLPEISFKPFDAYFFLFDDVLLMTKIKKPQKKVSTPAHCGHTRPTPF